MLLNGAAGLLTRGEFDETYGAHSLAPGSATILGVGWVVKVLLLPMSEPTVLVTSETPFSRKPRIFFCIILEDTMHADVHLLQIGEEECDASDTTSGGFSSASSCEEHGLGDTSTTVSIRNAQNCYWAFDQSSHQESDGETEVDAVKDISESRISVDKARDGGAADEERAQVCQADGVVGAVAGSNANMLHKSK